MISLLIAELEKNPHEPKLNADSPMVNFLSCTADSAPKFPSKLKHAIGRVEKSLASGGKVDKKALKEIENWFAYDSSDAFPLAPSAGKAIVTTTQAIDIINGGVKINALVSSAS